MGAPLFSEDGLEYHVLSKTHRDEVLMVLARAFCTEPVVDARGDANPRHKATIKDWIQWVDFWMDHCSTNGLSVVCIDPKAHRIAGAFIVRDLLMTTPGFDETYSSDENVLTPWMQCVWHLDEKATAVQPDIGKPGAAVDLWNLGVHPDYRGRRIASHMTKAVLPLIRDAGYEYGTIEATSHFTSCSAKSNDFTAIYELDVKDFEWKGEKLIANGVKAPHGKWTFWVKKLQDIGE